LVSHQDGAVHAAANWLMKTKLNQSINVKSKEQPSTVHRSWFTSPSKIDFVVVNNTNLQFLKSDLRVPWLFYQDALIIKQPRFFAIGATEITDELFREFLIELGVEKEYFSARTVKNGPANFALYIDILKFCRWLSERDGIPKDQIGLPAIEDIHVDMELPVDFLEKDGYRLPTATEWEIATRSGTVTACFFGNPMECLSTYAWNTSNTQLHAEPVGRLAPNPLGLFDTVGNVYDITLGGHGSW